MKAHRPRRLRAGRTGHLRSRRDDRQARATRRARPQPPVPSSCCFPEAFVPVYPTNRWVAAPRARPGHGAVRTAARTVGRGPRARTPTRLGAAARDARRLARRRRQRTRARHDLQLAAHLRRRRAARAPPPQAGADESRTARLGQGDGRGLETVDTGAALVGGLICWENLMPLARFALYERGVEIYLAPTADDSEDWHASLRHIARESRAFVLSSCSFQRASSYPADIPLADGQRTDRPRRLGDPRTRRLLSGRPALGRGGDPLRRPRPEHAARGAAAIRPCRPLPPTRRAVAHGHRPT